MQKDQIIVIRLVKHQITRLGREVIQECALQIQSVLLELELIVEVVQVASIAMLAKINKLKGRPYFNQFNREDNLENTNFIKGYKVVIQQCLIQHEFIGRLLSNCRTSKALYLSLTEQLLRTRILYLTSLIYYNYIKKGVSYLLRYISIYLLNSRIKQYIIDILSAFSICSSYLIV